MGGVTAVGVGIGLQAYGTYTGYKAAQKSAKYDAQIRRNNIAIAEEQIKDVTRAGMVTAKKLETETVHFIGDQVTAFASSGIDLSSAVVSEAVEQTARTGATDIIELQKNIEREKWGLKVGIMSEGAQIALDKAKARSAGRAAIIGTAATLMSLSTIPKTPTTVNPLQRTNAPRGVPIFNPNVALDF